MTGLPRDARWTFGSALVLLVMAASTHSVPAWSQNQGQVLPPVIRSCLADADNGRRLDCYDRESARLIMPPDRTGGGPAVAATSLPNALRACLAAADSGQRLDCYDREVLHLITPADRPAGGPVAMAPVLAPPPAAAASAAAATAVAAAPAPAAPTAPTHLSAHITSVSSDGDRILVRLDNGQNWQQSLAGPTDLSLRAGDSVKIDRQLGSWWLSNRYGESLQVRLLK